MHKYRVKCFYSPSSKSLVWVAEKRHWLFFWREISGVQQYTSFAAEDEIAQLIENEDMRKPTYYAYLIGKGITKNDA
jgi:hypothetical protein